ncbi:MAG: hypothetical protein IJ833_08020 [Lachnospiraceae bacterium]|nr:hypothetical protein [Lachnospiraceae bacterium]
MELMIQLLILVAGFALLVKGADFFVDGAAGIAKRFGIPELIIGLTIVAMGTSAPETAVSIAAACKGNADISIGNVVGSNIFNLLFVIGTAALIIPIHFAVNFRVDALIAIGAAILLWLSCVRTKKLGRVAGAIMLLGYGGYFLYLLM